MKKFFLALLMGSFMALMVSSCASVKKDCNGVKHYKTKNGIYL